MPRVGLTTGPGQIDQWQIVGERDQPMPGEHRLERRDVAHDVDYRQRSPRTRGHRRRGLEDLQQRIEPALGICAWQQRRRRIGTVQFGAGGDVGPELGFHEAFEDADHLRRLERPPTAGPQVDTTVDLVQPGGAVDVIGLGVIQGAVGVGEVLPPAHHRAEILERQMLRLVEQQLDHLDQQGPTPRVAVRPGEFDHLGAADVTGQQRLAHRGARLAQGNHPPHRRHVQPRPVGVGPHPPLDRTVPVVAVHTTSISHRHHRHGLRLDPSALQLQLPEPLRDRVVVEPHQLLDEILVHGRHRIEHMFDWQLRRVKISKTSSQPPPPSGVGTPLRTVASRRRIGKVEATTTSAMAVALPSGRRQDLEERSRRRLRPVEGVPRAEPFGITQMRVVNGDDFDAEGALFESVDRTDVLDRLARPPDQLALGRQFEIDDCQLRVAEALAQTDRVRPGLRVLHEHVVPSIRADAEIDRLHHLLERVTITLQAHTNILMNGCHSRLGSDRFSAAGAPPRIYVATVDLDADLIAYYEAEARSGRRVKVGELRQGLLNTFRELVVAEGRRHLIDVGAGPGLDTAAWRAEGLDVVGVDLTEANVRMMGERGLVGVTGSLYDLPFRDARSTRCGR